MIGFFLTSERVVVCNQVRHHDAEFWSALGCGFNDLMRSNDSGCESEFQSWANFWISDTCNDFVFKSCWSENWGRDSEAISGIVREVELISVNFLRDRDSDSEEDVNGRLRELSREFLWARLALLSLCCTHEYQTSWIHRWNWSATTFECSFWTTVSFLTWASIVTWWEKTGCSINWL